MLSTAIATLYSAAIQVATSPDGPAIVVKKVEPTAFDKLGAVLALITLVACGIVLLALSIWMNVRSASGRPAVCWLVRSTSCRPASPGV